MMVMMKNGQQHETNLSLTVILFHIIRWREEIQIPPIVFSIHLDNCKGNNFFGKNYM